MTTTDCEKLKQNRDDAYTQLVLVQIEAKENSSKKGIFGLFKKPKEGASPEKMEPSAEELDLNKRLAAAQKKYEDAKKIYEKNCKK